MVFRRTGSLIISVARVTQVSLAIILFLLLLGLASDLFLFFTARGGQLETLQWLMTRKAIRKEYLLASRACEGGNLEMIRWPRNEGCPWNEKPT